MRMKKPTSILLYGTTYTVGDHVHDPHFGDGKVNEIRLASMIVKFKDNFYMTYWKLDSDNFGSDLVKVVRS